MEQNTRERLRRWTITCSVLGGLALLAGVGLLLYGNSAPPHPLRPWFDMSYFWRGVASMAGIGLTLSGFVLVGTLLLSALVSRISRTRPR